MNQDAQTRTTAARYVGDWPRIGIRPAIDGRRRGVRELLEEQTMGQARRTAELLSANLRYPDGQPVECVIADTCIGGVAEAAQCAEKFAREGVGRLAHRHALLVLRLRDDGHGPAHAQGGVGLQRHRASRRGLPGGGARRPHQKGLPAFGIYGRDVQDCGDAASPPTCRRSCCASPAPGWPWRSCAASPISRWAASRWASPARSSTRPSSRTTSGCASRRVDMTEFIRRIDEGIYDKEEYERASPGREQNCKEGKDCNPAGSSAAASRRNRTGRRRSRWR